MSATDNATRRIPKGQRVDRQAEPRLFGTERSMSYVEWLRLRYGPDRAEQQVVDDRAAPEQVLVSVAGERPQPHGNVGRAQHAAGPQHL
jgi:hypothetical protein